MTTNSRDALATYFAPALRVEPFELRKEIETTGNNPLIDSLLRSVSCLIAVLNRQRQIVAVNDIYIQSLGIKNTEEIFGLRPGESLHCVHAREMPGGCGTSKSCLSCGAAIAIVSSLAEGKPVEKQCAVTAERDGETVDLCFSVRVSPLEFDGEQYLLLFLRDITAQEKRIELERVFFHDINNILQGLIGSCKLLKRNAMSEDDRNAWIDKVCHLSYRLASEFSFQRLLVNTDTNEEIEDCDRFDFCSTQQIVEEIVEIFSHHPVGNNKRLLYSSEIPEFRFRTDSSFLFRILSNMVVNAFEATEPGGHVRFWYETSDYEIVFFVWNERYIPEEIAQRIFQCHFSTKKQPGRGFGTYGMKVLGEKYLKGKVSFTTDREKGTTFRLSLPLGA